MQRAVDLFTDIFLGTVRFLGALVVSYLFFILIPVLHALFGNDIQAQSDQLNSHKIVAQVVKKEEKKKKQEKRRIRKVHSDKMRRNMSGFKMKFAPNLGSIGGQGVGVAAQEMEAVIFQEGETDEQPTPMRITPIPYPKRAKALGISGELIIEIVIGRKGQVESMKIIKSPHSSFSAEARKIVMGWKFKPGRNKGVPVRVRARKVIEFKLD